LYHFPKLQDYFSKVKYKKRAPFKRANNHRNSNESFGNGSMNNSSRVTGSLSTVLEKYRNLAKDATSSGDYVGAENYLQHAEHYSRMINERNARTNGTSNGKANGSHEIDETYEADSQKAKSKEISEETEESKSIN
tara:strand:+ start:1003 stop:1410 length:408 start_codon:yes stop_codon:yes gene_type:complete